MRLPQGANTRVRVPQGGASTLVRLTRAANGLEGSDYGASSINTGAWSLGDPTLFLPVLRSSRTISPWVTRSANAGEPRMKSIRMPRFLGKRSCV